MFDQRPFALLFRVQRRLPIERGIFFRRRRQRDRLAGLQRHAERARLEIVFDVRQAALGFDAMLEAAPPAIDRRVRAARDLDEVRASRRQTLRRARPSGMVVTSASSRPASRRDDRDRCTATFRSSVIGSAPRAWV